jgi:hypothetical protein
MVTNYSFSLPHTVMQPKVQSAYDPSTEEYIDAFLKDTKVAVRTSKCAVAIQELQARLSHVLERKNQLGLSPSKISTVINLYNQLTRKLQLVVCINDLSASQFSLECNSSKVCTQV